MLIYLLQVVLAPVLLGALLNQYCNGLVQLVSPLMPFIAVATVAVLCGNAIAQNASAILASGSQVVLSVGCLHASGFFFGYVLSRLLGIDISSARTISIEVGMQVTGVEIVYHYLISDTDDLKFFISFCLSNS
jgi:BASS family bile acid:Na+ symporter